jgi:hypothetical protein
LRALIKQLWREHPIPTAALGMSYLGAVALKLSGVAQEIAVLVGLPALVISIWVALGHLITLDDDYPGGWSNPEDDKEYWKASLRELAKKLLVLAFLALVLAAA